MPVAIGQLSITLVLDGSSFEEQYAANTSPTAAPTAGWSSSIPAPVAGQFVWRRSRAVHADGTHGAWGEAVRITGAVGEPGAPGETGPAGPAGNPGAIGVNADGSTIMVAGFNTDGEFGYPTGIVYLGTSRYQLNEASYTVTSSGQGYILANASGVVRFTRLVAEASGGSPRMVWKDFNSGTEITSDAVIGRFTVESLAVTMAQITPVMGLDQFIRSQFMEILRTSDATDAQLQDMAIALGADRIFQTIVAIDAFIKSLWVSRLESEIYSTDANGYPNSGFHLDGVTGIAKIASLMAKNADIVGSFTSDGFRTLPQVSGTTVPTATVSPTVFKYSEMCALISDSDARTSVSGTIEGFTFTLATRRSGKRVLLHSTGSSSSTISPAGGFSDPTIMNRITPVRLFGDNFFTEWHIDYQGAMGYRLLWRTKPGQTAEQVFNDHQYRENTGTEEDPEWIEPERTEGELWNASKGAGSYSGSHGVTTERCDITLWVYSGALWGSVDATSNHLKVWTNRTFNGLVLTNADASYVEVPFQPDAYYLASSKSFTVGSTTQDSASMKKYRSGTDFYNLFSSIPVGTNSAATGAVRINGTTHTVSRLRKDEDKIVFFTGTQEVHVRKFVNGTSTGVYTDLAITTSIVLGAMAGGIESMWIVPWAHAAYDIGQTSKRFRSMYLSGEMVSGSVQATTVAATTVTGTVNASGTTNKVWGAVFN